MVGFWLVFGCLLVAMLTLKQLTTQMQRKNNGWILVGWVGIWLLIGCYADVETMC